ncbi:Uncharacterised protein [Vibrio cholerae]|nr:Uncharacterised protein [Vibrio cholerae]CSD34279.1 Uncharacterised protein [Vibrio cholerae]
MTKSPASVRLTISLSAISNPEETCSARILSRLGSGIRWLATKVHSTPVRSAARISVSRITFGHASASTQIFMLALLCLCFRALQYAL